MTTEYIGNELGATPIVNPAKATIAKPEKDRTEIWSNQLLRSNIIISCQ